jgi:DNA topoisomerase-1
MIGSAMGTSLVIVESPAKARTISGFLDDGYVVESSIGHIRDLPDKVSQLPQALRKKPWAKLAVNVEKDFEPIYIVPQGKKKQIAKLKKLMKEADELLLATDEDREGESIAWHLLEELDPEIPVRRMVFHEITRQAIEAAVAAPREIDENLVKAQEARRILDRLYGFEVSEVLWKKVKGGLSAGRVQSVALRLIVDRERERREFRKAAYWSLHGQFAPEGTRESFRARLAEVDGVRIAGGKDFDAQGRLKRWDRLHLEQARAEELLEELGSAACAVESIEQKPWRRSPQAPFMTSTLQQAAGRQLGFSASRTMRIAQGLYEGGYITYMRTDSTTLSDAALRAARAAIESRFGADYLPAAPRTYTKKVKNAQEAHEAIRPAGESFRSPQEVARALGDRDAARLYELIWKRTIASQMKDAEGFETRVRVSAATTGGERLTFSASGLTITFAGYREAYSAGAAEKRDDEAAGGQRIPELAEGQSLDGSDFEAERHETKPPPRFTEASLVRRLEELGVGRPSTYAAIFDTIRRKYIWMKGRAMVPTFTAIAVIDLLEKHFGELVDYEFTAWMEDELDRIADGTEQSVPFLRRFYFGDSGEQLERDSDLAPDRGLHALVSEHLPEIDARSINTFDLGEDDEGRTVALRIGRYGPFLERGDDRASVPDDLPPDELTIERAVELLAHGNGERPLGTDPKTGLEIYVKQGPHGPYFQLGEGGGKEKPKRASLIAPMLFETADRDDALKVLALPREVGVDPADGNPVLAQNGPYGPYVRKGREFRSLPNEEAIFTVTLEEALKLLAQPKGKRREPETLRELGPDPVSGQTITLRKGRYGPYVTDGEVNQSLLKGDTPEDLTPERAAELLQRRRDRGPTKRRSRRKKS